MGDGLRLVHPMGRGVGWRPVQIVPEAAVQALDPRQEGRVHGELGEPARSRLLEDLAGAAAGRPPQTPVVLRQWLHALPAASAREGPRAFHPTTMPVPPTRPRASAAPRAKM